jgi:hypothetical protein
MKDRVVWFLAHVCLAPAGVLLLGGTPAHAATSEAHRHVNAEGIELISSRQTAASASAGSEAVAPARPSRAAGSAGVASLPAAAGTLAVPARAGYATVSSKEQRLRDQDRLAILQQELNTETGHYQRTRQALDHPAVKGGADRDAVQRLSDQLARHEQNIKALHAEIRRTHPANDR